jgi:hypothetical protein
MDTDKPARSANAQMAAVYNEGKAIDAVIQHIEARDFSARLNDGRSLTRTATLSAGSIMSVRLESSFTYLSTRALSAGKHHPRLSDRPRRKLAPVVRFGQR